MNTELDRNMENQPPTSFRIGHSGPSIRDGRIEVYSLAPALLAAQQIMEAVGKELYGPRTQVRVRIVAHKAGSFWTILEPLVSFVANNPDVALDMALRVTVSLISLAKKIGRSFPSKTERISEGRCRVTVNGETFETSEVALRLLCRKDIQDAIEALVAIRGGTSGIHAFTIESDQGTEEVTQADWSEFLELPDEREVADGAMASLSVAPFPRRERELGFREGEYEIVSVPLSGSRRWRLKDETGTISARMADERFLDKVNARSIRFARGDRLVCWVRSEEHPSRRGTRTRHVIEKVSAYLSQED
ncbi:MAG: hypothetical protein OXC14_15425 [Rhodospirillaceae bacterium]|nr:hypothetical protein [Rhodospirillaceae bacterium]